MLVSDLLLSKRRCGHTEYMLRAAINDPKVTIVCGNERQVEMLEKRYQKLLDQQPWYKRLWWRWTERRWPEFVSIGQAHRTTNGICEPLMFDNLTLIQDHQR